MTETVHVVSRNPAPDTFPIMFRFLSAKCLKQIKPDDKLCEKCSSPLLINIKSLERWLSR